MNKPIRRELTTIISLATVWTFLGGACSGPPPSARPSSSAITIASAAPELTSVPSDAFEAGPFAPSVIAFLDRDHGLAGGQIGPGDTAKGAIAVTLDGGVTWAITPPVPRVATAITAVGHHAWALTSCPNEPEAGCGALLHSADAGETWDVLATTGEVRPIGGTLSFVDATTGWAVGSERSGGDTVPGLGRNQLLTTTDGGSTWSAGPIPCGQDWPDLVAIQFVDPERGWAVCSGQGSGTMAPTQVLETRDGGGTWHERSSAANFGGPARLVGRPPSGPVAGAFFTAGGHGWVWQARSGTQRSLDGGETWDFAPPGRSEEDFVSSMSFISETEGFAMYSSTQRQALVLGATEDGGDHWRVVQSWPNR